MEVSIIECGLRVPTTWKRPGREAHAGLAGDPRLRAGDQRLDVAERGIEVVALVQPVAVEAAELVLPERLPLGEHQLLQLAVGADEDAAPRRPRSRSGP